MENKVTVFAWRSLSVMAGSRLPVDLNPVDFEFGPSRVVYKTLVRDNDACPIVIMCKRITVAAGKFREPV